MHYVPTCIAITCTCDRQKTHPSPQTHPPDFSELARGCPGSRGGRSAAPTPAAVTCTSGAGCWQQKHARYTFTAPYNPATLCVLRIALLLPRHCVESVNLVAFNDSTQPIFVLNLPSVCVCPLFLLTMHLSVIAFYYASE